MTTNRNRLVAAAAFSIMAVGALLISIHDVKAQNPVPGSAPVNLVSPLPLPITGTVEITGAPTSVTIDNTTAQPVPVKNVDQIERVQFRGVFTAWAGGAGLVDLVTVPAGKLLVIEDVSVLVNENSGTPVSSCGLTTSDFGGPVRWMVCQPTASNALNHIHVASGPTLMYAGPGTTVRAFVNMLGSGEGFITGAIAGYFVPAP